MAESSMGGLGSGVKEPGTGISVMKKPMAASQDKLHKEGLQKSNESAKAKDVIWEGKDKKPLCKKGSENSKESAKIKYVPCKGKLCKEDSEKPKKSAKVKDLSYKGELSKDNSENLKRSPKGKDHEGKLSKVNSENPKRSAQGKYHDGKLLKGNYENTKESDNGKDLPTLGKLINVDIENTNCKAKEMEIDGAKVENSKGELKQAPALDEVSNKKVKKKKKHKKKDTTSEIAKEEKKSSLGGLIFMCNSETKRDCFKYRVFGLPESKKDSVDKVRKGVKLFLFDVDKRIMYGVYKASSQGGMNLVGEAFKGSNRSFPAQVRFRIQKNCMPLEECDFRQAIKDNYYQGNKFTCELRYDQVSKLVKLFRPLDVRGLPKAKSGKDLKKESKLNSRRAAPRSSRYDNRGPHLPQSSAWQFLGHPQSRDTLHLGEHGYLMEPMHTVSLRDYVPFRETAPLNQSNGAPLSQGDLHNVHNARDYGAASSINEIGVQTSYMANPMERLQMREARLKALERMAYAPNPIGDAVMNKASYLEGLYAEQGTIAPKTTIQDETLYREFGNQRNVCYNSSYSNGMLGISGALPYDSAAPQLQLPRSYRL